MLVNIKCKLRTLNLVQPFFPTLLREEESLFKKFLVLIMSYIQGYDCPCKEFMVLRMYYMHAIGQACVRDFSVL